MPTATINNATNPEIVLNAAAALLNGVIVGLDKMTVEALVGFCGWPSVYSETIAIVVTDGVPEVVEAVVTGPEVGVTVEVGVAVEVGE